MMTKRRAIPVAAALVFLFASCGGSSDEGAVIVESESTVAAPEPERGEDFTPVEGDEDAPVAGESADDDSAATEPEADAEEATTTAPDPVTGTDLGEAAASPDVALTEWSIDAPLTYAAGEITFQAANSGQFPHELAVIEGQSYDLLPLAEGGGVIEEDLATGALIGRTGRIAGGASESLTVTLTPGTYVLICNLGAGANSHAGQGQRLDIVVT